jgi:hypothetical protein
MSRQNITELEDPMPIPLTRQRVLDVAQCLRLGLSMTDEVLDLAAGMLETLAPDGAESIRGGRDGNKSYGTRCTCSFVDGHLAIVCPDHLRAQNERVAEVVAKGARDAT